MRRITSPRTAARQRSGIAPIELVLALPLLMLLLLAILTVCSFGLTQTSVEVRARQHAWSQRFADRSPERLPAGGLAPLTQVLGPGVTPPPDGGLRRGASRATAVSLAPNLWRSLADREAGHLLLSDPWDDRTIPFEPDRDAHAPLETSLRVLYFRHGVPLVRDAFMALADLGGGSTDGASLAAGLAQGQASDRRIDHAVAQIQDEMARVRDALERALEQEPPDDGAIADLREQLDELEAQLQRLQDAAEALNTRDPRPALPDSE